MSLPQTVLQGADTVIQADLYLSFELERQQWTIDVER